MRAQCRVHSHAPAFRGGGDRGRGCGGGASGRAAPAARASAHRSRGRSFPQRLEQARFARPHQPVITRALALSLLALTAACGGSSRDSRTLEVSTAKAATAQTTSLSAAPADSSLATQRRTAITQAVARVAPTVVTVQTEVVDRST